MAVVLCLVSGQLSGQEKRNLRFDRLTFEDGLSQAFVTAAIQDPEGFMWFGTQEGLNRFDGYEFVTLTHDPDDPSSLASDFVKAIFFDSKGTLWVGTEGGGLSRRTDQGGFVHYRHDPNNEDSISSDWVRVIHEDRVGRMWIGTDAGGLNIFDRATGVFRTVPLPSEDETDGVLRIRSISEASDGALWIGTEGGGLHVIRPNGQTSSFRHDPANPRSLSDDRVRSTLVDDDGKVWVGTYEGGLALLDPIGKEFRRFIHDPRDSSSLAAGTVWVLYRDSEQTLWVGTDGGLNEMDPKSGSFLRYVHNPSNLHSLSNNRVVSIYQDRSGVMWVGTYAGISKWNNTSAAFRLYQSHSNESSQLSENFVTAFAEHLDGTIWVGTYGGGLNRFDRGTQKFEHFRHRSGDATSLLDDRVSALWVDKKGLVWVGTLSGLNRLDSRSGRFEAFQHDPDDPTSLSFDGVTSIFEDRYGRLWVGTYGGGLNWFDRSTESFGHYRHSQQDPKSISSDRVLSFFEDRSGTLWIGTHGGGLNRYEREDDSFSHIRNVAGDSTSLSSDNAWSIIEDPRGDLWVGTQGGGVNRWRAGDRRNGKVAFQRFTESGGLPSGTVNGVLYDDDWNIWLSTNRGLARLEPEAGEYAYYDHTHGLQGDEFNAGAFLRANDGELFFGGISGFNSFYTRDVRRNMLPPQIAFTRIVKRSRGQSVEHLNTRAGDFVLKHYDNVLSFDFAALDFSAPTKNRYMHRLQGFETGWVDDNQRRATYTNLKPGSYTFRVLASNNDLVWTEEDLTVDVKVLAPPWKTLWAYLVYLAIGVAVLGIYMRAQLKKRERKLNLEDKEKELDLEKTKAKKYLDVAEVIMLVLDPESKATLINPKGCKVLDCEAGDVVGQSFSGRYVDSADRGAFETMVTSRKEVESCESTLLTATGAKRNIVWQAVALTDDEGKRTSTLLSGTDITQAKWLAAARERAELANKAKSQFLANMSHEIRTPIGGVLGMIELLAESGLNSKQMKFADAARRSTRSLLDLLTDILDLSKIEAGKLELESVSFDLPDVIDDVCELFSGSAMEKGLSFSQRLDPKARLAVLGDPTRLRQVLSNLINNAVKFTNEGSVEVRVFPLHDQQTIRFEVIDTGIGLAPGAEYRVFESFHQADGSTTRNYEGTGLGLAIARQLVEHMGGAIGVASSPNKGSTFWFEIPLEKRNQGSRHQKLRELGLEGVIVAILENDRNHRTHLEDTLASWGIETRILDSTADVLSQLRDFVESSQGPQMALIDSDLEVLNDAVAKEPALANLDLIRIGSTVESQDGRRDGFAKQLIRPVRQPDLFDAITLLALKNAPVVDEVLADSGPSLEGVRILVAEDNPVLQDVVTGMVVSFGGQFDLVRSGLDAVSAVEKRRYDLVLMDIQMPMLDGYEATANIRRREHERGAAFHLPIVAMTASAMAGDREKCLAAGMNGYISKPFTMAALKEVILRWLSPQEPAWESGPLPAGALRELSVDRKRTVEQEPAQPSEVAGGKETASGCETAVDRASFASEEGWQAVKAALAAAAADTSFDPSILAGFLAGGQSGPSELVANFITGFLESTPTYCRELRKAQERADTKKLQRTAHSLKGTAAMMGATGLASLCEDLQTMEADSVHCRALVGRLESEAGSVCSALENVPGTILRHFGSSEGTAVYDAPN